jgi:uncharacterized protein (DUF58 family)
MLPVEVLRQIRRLQIRARRAVQTLLGGEYHSAFKGSGLAFEDVREYQPGDDIRGIDWNVTARTGTPFVKRYVEERELTVILAVDVSGSQNFGTQAQTKRAVAAELAALVAFCAISNQDRVGLLAFTDRVEKYIPPNKGTRHVLRILRDILYFEPEQRGTDLKAALDHLNKVQKRRAIVFLLSDFLTAGFDDSFKRAARQHDLIAVRTTDVREAAWPAAGLIQLEDAETDEPILIDSSSHAFRTSFAAGQLERRDRFINMARSAQADWLEVGTEGRHFDTMLKFFRSRERRKTRG